MKTLTNVTPDIEVPPEVSGKKKQTKKKKTACLAAYLIATGQHLSLLFPLLVSWALTCLISSGSN